MNFNFADRKIFPHTNPAVAERIIHKKYLNEAAAILPVNDKKQVLLMLRDDNPEIIFPNYWSVIGGHLDPGESVEEAVVREAKEEINYTPINPQPFCQTFDPVKSHLVHFFVCRMEKDISELARNEGADLKFFSKDEVVDLRIVPYLKEAVIHYYKIFSE